MADYKATTAEFQSVANAIRTKGGTQAQLEWPTGFVSAVQAIPTGGGGVVEPLSVTQNGTYNPPSGVDGYAPVTVNVAGGGDVPLLSGAQWQALTVQQKRSYGLVAIQDAITGYYRGALVNGADYIGELKQWGTGSAASTITDTLGAPNGRYSLLVLAINSESSLKALDIDVQLNGTSITGETISYNRNNQSSDNVRNYRLNKYTIDVTQGEEISFSVENANSHSSVIWVLLDFTSYTFDKAMSKADTQTSGTNVNNGFILKGLSDDNKGGSIEFDSYTANTSVATGYPGSNYKSSFIFWFTY